MVEIVLFGGTTEGRFLSELLQEKGIPAVVCVATEYGESLLPAGGTLRVYRERLDETGITALLRREKPRLVLDATHPYAARVTDNLRRACAATGVPYHRVRRSSQWEDGCIPFPDMDALTAWLTEQPGVIFSTLGAKEARPLTAVPKYRERIFVRILPSRESLDACLDAGFPAGHIICMQGPFSRELNEAMFRAVGADILLTKESGAAGGFAEKVEAARRCGMKIAVWERPADTAGETAEEWAKRIREGRL